MLDNLTLVSYLHGNRSTGCRLMPNATKRRHRWTPRSRYFNTKTKVTLVTCDQISAVLRYTNVTAPLREPLKRRLSIISVLRTAIRGANLDIFSRVLSSYDAAGVVFRQRRAASQFVVDTTILNNASTSWRRQTVAQHKHIHFPKSYFKGWRLRKTFYGWRQ